MQAVIGKDVKILKGEIISGDFLKAYTTASNVARKGGYIASLPQLVEGRLVADFADPIWQEPFIANSEEAVGVTKAGNEVLVVVHGGGIMTPKRYAQAFAEGLTPASGARLYPDEFYNLLSGRTYSGEIFLCEGLKGLELKPAGVEHYAVVLDFALAKQSRHEQMRPAEFAENPVAVARAGSQERALAYAQKTNAEQGVGNYHAFNQTEPRLQPELAGLLHLGPRKPPHNSFAAFGSSSGLYPGRPISNFVVVQSEKISQRNSHVPSIDTVVRTLCAEHPALNPEALRETLEPLYDP